MLYIAESAYWCRGSHHYVYKQIKYTSEFAIMGVLKCTCHLPWKVLGVAFSLWRNSTSLLILSGLHHDFGTFFSGELAVALFKTLPKAFHAILRTWKRPLYYGRSPKVWDIIGIVDKGLVGFSLCRVVFALGQAKFCVFANFIRIARLFWHFSQGNWLLSLFSCVVFKRMQKNVKLARGLWLLTVPVLINFPCGKR